MSLEKGNSGKSQYQGHVRRAGLSSGEASRGWGIPWSTAIRGMADCFRMFALTWFSLLITENIFVPSKLLWLLYNYMLITTQHSTESKTDSTANTTVI